MKAIWSLLLSLVLMLLVLGCEEVERENPLDAQNQRTGGAPPGLTGRVGDGRVILSWPNLGLEEVKEYRLYRAYLTPDPDQFDYMDSVLASVLADDKYEWKTDVPSDPSDFHFYRVFYVDNEEREVPLGIMVHVDGKKVILSWPDLGLDVSKEYRIYRASVILTPDQFQYVVSVKARPVDELKQYVYADTGLQNEYGNLYLYRLSYADSGGRETPDPENPLNLNENWFLIDVIPSEAPPVPNVQVIADRDLEVRLIWEGYSWNAPEDLAGFRVYSASKAEDGREQPPLTLVAQIDPNVEYYVDGNEYPGTINFRKDGLTKLYKVVAFDTVGVESDSPVLEGTSPNLPPSLPLGINVQYTDGRNNYKARITWRRNPEPDIAGYVLYEVGPEGEPGFKQVIHDPNANSITITDSYLFGFMMKQYFVTAFDNTPKPDGKRDESLTMPQPPEPFPTDLEEPSVGDLAPDFTLPKLDGGTMSLQDVRGKVVLIDFWATWCGPCVAEVPHIQDLYEKYRARDLVVLGVNTWERAGIQVVGDFRDEHGLTYDILLDMDEDAALLYNVDAIPSVWILDRNGIITWKHVGYGPGGEVEIEQQILAVL